VDNNTVQNKRKVIILVSALDSALSGIVLLIYFGLLPVDLSGIGISHSLIGIIAGIWFASALAVLAYQLTKTDDLE
jgi:hypothetical protein